MRIIAGVARRTRLEVAAGSSTRPFLEMARGALFNALGAAVDEARVLDLYAGSGALGLEALSRGASSCVFVERDPKAQAALARNIGKCGFTDVSRRIRSDVGQALAGLTERFELIFVDPPFPELGEWHRGGGAETVMRAAAAALAPGGVLVFRLEDGKASTPDWPGLAAAADRRYGRSRVVRYIHGEEGAAGDQHG